MPPEEKAERAAAVLVMRADGKTYREIGEVFDLCASRIHQIVREEAYRARYRQRWDAAAAWERRE
jgi:DNA-binding NarL/FixJ family response regulator